MTVGEAGGGGEEPRGRAAQCVTAARKFAIPKRVRGTCRAGLTRVRAPSPPHPSPSSSSVLPPCPPRDRNLLRKCRYVEMKEPRVVTPPSPWHPRKYSLRGCCLDCVLSGAFFTRVLSMKAFPLFGDYPAVCFQLLVNVADKREADQRKIADCCFPLWKFSGRDQTPKIRRATSRSFLCARILSICDPSIDNADVNEP